jgi:hypothetical protein
MKIKILTNILQKKIFLLILYLFYNIDFIKIIKNNKLIIV